MRKAVNPARADYRKWLKWLRIAYLAVLAGAAAWAAVRYRAEVADLLTGTRPGWLILSLISSLGMILWGALFWTCCLRMLGSRPSLREVTLVTARTLPARYIPGSVWFAVGRVGLLRVRGLPLGSLSVTAGLEIVLSLGTALACGAAISGAVGIFPGGYWWVIPLVALLIGGAAPPLGGRVLRWAAARRGWELRLTWSGYWRLMGITLLFWAWSAMTFLFYMRAFPADDRFGTILAAGAFLLTWGLSFLAPFAPQGIGVFEVLLALMLGVEEVAGMAVVWGGYRIIIGTRDILAAALAELLASRRGARAGREEEEGGEEHERRDRSVSDLERGGKV